MQILFYSFSQTNCLSALISITSQQIINAQNCKYGKFEVIFVNLLKNNLIILIKSEVYLFIENDYSKFDVPDLDIELFNKILLCFLQMTLRDEISQFWRRQNNNLEALNDQKNIEIQNEYEMLEKRFTALFLPLTKLNDENNEKSFNKTLLDNEMNATFVFQKYFL